MKVYVTSPRGKEKLVQAFEKEGCEVVNKLSTDVKLIVPTVDEELPFFSRSREYFKSQGIEVMVSSDYTIDMCRDKAEFSRFCKRHGFAHPSTGQFEAIIKPRFGKGSKGIIKIDRSYIVQDIVPFPEYSVDSYCGAIRKFIPRKRLNIINGESTAAEINLQETIGIAETADRLAAQLGIYGPACIQGWWTGKTFIVGEVNCRFGGGFWLTQDIAPTVKWMVDEVRD